MPALSIRIALDCFYLLIFYSEKFSTDVCRLPYAVNVNLNLSIVLLHKSSVTPSTYQCISMYVPPLLVAIDCIPLNLQSSQLCPAARPLSGHDSETGDTAQLSLKEIKFMRK